MQDLNLNHFSMMQETWFFAEVVRHTNIQTDMAHELHVYGELSWLTPIILLLSVTSEHKT